MSFSRLADLSSLVAKPAETPVVTEAKASDMDGIKGVISDALEDLHDKVAMLMDMAKESGAMKLDTVKDKDGMTVFKKIDKLTKDYKKAMESLMTEAEAMVMQVAESQVDQAPVLLEAKDYSDSSEFTDEFYGVIQKVNEIKRAVKAPRWMAWMKTTDHNFSTNCEALGRDVITAVNALDKSITELEDNLDSAM